MELRSDVAAPDGFDGDVPPDFDVLVASRDGMPVGVVVMRTRDTVADVRTVWVDPAHTGVEADVLAAAVARSGERTVTVGVAADQVALHRLLQGAPVFGELMSKPVAHPLPALRPGYGYRPMTAAEYDDWHDAHVVSYAQDGLARAGGDMDLAMARSRADFARLLPSGLTTPDQSLVVLLWHGDAVGTLWLGHHRDGTRETFGFDFEIDPARRGEGLGRAAMAVGEHLAAAAGDTSLGLHVFGGNVVAITLYRSWGFRSQHTTYDASSWTPA